MIAQKQKNYNALQKNRSCLFRPVSYDIKKATEPPLPDLQQSKKRKWRVLGYLFLACALLAGVTKGYCGKRTSGLITGFSDAVLTNLLRIGLCIFIGFAVVCFEGNLQQLAPSGKLLWISALSGMSTAAFVATWLICVRKSAYMLMDVFLTLGMLIPLLLSNLLFDEKIRLQQWLGMAFC